MAINSAFWQHLKVTQLNDINKYKIKLINLNTNISPHAYKYKHCQKVKAKL